jgi:hypothetical protein
MSFIMQSIPKAGCFYLIFMGLLKIFVTVLCPADNMMERSQGYGSASIKFTGCLVSFLAAMR